MLSEKAWTFILSRRRLSRTIGTLVIIFLAIFVPWLIAEGYLLDLQSRVDGKHELRISNFQHVFHENFILGTGLESGGEIIRNGGIEIIITNSNIPRSEILNQSWAQWTIPSNYTQLVLTINTSSVSLTNLSVRITNTEYMLIGPIEIPPGKNSTIVIDFNNTVRSSSFFIKFDADNVVVFDVWGEPTGDVVSPPLVVSLMRQIYGIMAPPVLLFLVVSLSYLGYQLARFYYVGWKIEKTQGLMARLKWEKQELRMEDERELERN